MSGGGSMAAGWLSFRRIVDIPYGTCMATVGNWQGTGPHSDRHIRHSLLRGPIEHGRATDDYRIEVRLACEPLRPLPPMRLTLDRWSGLAARTALEFIPGTRVRPTTAYFRVGPLLDALTRRFSNLDDLHYQERQVTGAPLITPNRSATRQRTRSAEPADMPPPSCRARRQAARSRAAKAL